MKFTEEQESFVLKNFEEGTNEIKKLTTLVIDKFFPEAPENLKDGRSVYGRAVKKILAARGKETTGTHQYKPVDETLSEQDKEFVRNNRSYMSSVEMTRVIENDPNITNLHKKARLVEEYNKSLETQEERPAEVPRDIGSYSPPKTAAAAITRINGYVLDGINKNKLLGKQKKDISSLIRYLNTYRFIHQANTYEDEEGRTLFESSFVRYTYDKGDLSQEEVDQYIVLSTEVVIASNIQRRISRLSQLLDETADDTDGRRMSMSLVDAIGNSQTEYNQCIGRQTKLLSDLKEKRSDKLKKQIQDNASILNLVGAWKEEESRNKIIKLAELRKKTVEQEVDNLSEMSELKSKILGISENEVLNG